MYFRFESFLLLVSFIIWSWESMAQVTIWEEVFNSYPDGTTSGINLNTANPDIDWVTGGCISCPDSVDDWWEVRSGLLEAKDLNMLGYLQTELIDISGFQQIQFSIDVVESGDLEGLYFGTDDCFDQDNQDYVDILYRIDGGSWVLVNNYLNWCGLYASCANHTLYGDDGEASGDCRTSDDDWGSVKVSIAGLSGQTLELRVELINSSDTEIIGLDNLIISGEAVLPIELLSFEITLQGKQAVLEWRTAYERNNRGFVIERNTVDPIVESYWQRIAEIRGVGESYDLQNYRFVDENPLAGSNYYRLKQLDWDGSFCYSPILAVQVPPELMIYPNPVHKLVYLTPELSPDCEVEWFNGYGQMIKVDPIKIQDELVYSVAHLASGWYQILIICSQTKESRSLLVHH